MGAIQRLVEFYWVGRLLCLLAGEPFLKSTKIFLLSRYTRVPWAYRNFSGSGEFSCPAYIAWSA